MSGTIFCDSRTLFHQSCSTSARVKLNKVPNPIINSTNTQIRFQSLIRKRCENAFGSAVRNQDYGGKGRRWVESVKCAAEDFERSGIRSENVVVEGKERYRYAVVCLVAFVMGLCSADRTVMSVAIVPFAQTHGWSTSFIGIIQSSFLWGYIISSVIGGAMADKFGGARVMAWGVALWSLATLLTPWAANHSAATLLAVRVVFGLAQGVAFPSMNILLSRWFPIHERARAVGLSMAGFQLGNVLGLCITPFLMSLIGISGPFVLFSSFGLLWLVQWVYGVTSNPTESRFVSYSELQLIQAGKLSDSSHTKGENPSLRFGLLLPNMSFWAVVLSNFTNNWGYFVLLSWMPIYFKTVSILEIYAMLLATYDCVPFRFLLIVTFPVDMSLSIAISKRMMEYIPNLLMDLKLMNTGFTCEP